MTDEGYKKFLNALAAKHIRKGAIGSGEDLESRSFFLHIRS